ncbi:MAG: carbohydrate ABC transporter permease [Haloarculaceae archaeon]
MAQPPAEETSQARLAELLPSFGLTDPDSEISWYLLVFPKVVLFLFLLILPFLGLVWISLHEWGPLAATKPFVGLDNYVRLLTDSTFHKALINTASYSASLLLFDVPIALGLALLLDMNLRGTRFYSAAIFLPVVTSWVVVSLIWTWLYQPDYGMINSFLQGVGLPTLEWLNSRHTALASISIMSIWKHVGFNMVIFLAGLKGIPNQYYEAAAIDGADRWQRFRNITLPLLKPTSFLVVLVTMIFSFRLFAQVYVMTGGGPVHSSTSIVYYLWQQGFKQFNMGYASAIAVVLFVIVFALSLIQNRYAGDDVEY